MTKLGILLKMEWKQLLAEPRVLLIALLTPFLLITLSIYLLAPLVVKQQWIDPFSIAVVNLDPAWETVTLMSQLEQSEEISSWLQFQHLSRQEAQRQLLAKQVAAIIVIPQGFSQSLHQGLNTPFEVITSPTQPVQGEIVATFIQSGANLISAAQSGLNTVYHYMGEAGYTQAEREERFQQLLIQFTLKALARDSLFAKEKVTLFQGVSPANYYALSLGLVFTALMGMLTIQTKGGQLDRLNQRLRLYSVSYRQRTLVTWLSYVFSLSLPMLSYLCIWIVWQSFFTLPEQSLAFSWAQLLSLCLFTCLILFAWAAFFVLTTSLASKPTTQVLLTSCLLALMFLLSGTLIPKTYLPAMLHSLVSLTIPYWSMQSLLQVFFYPVGTKMWVPAMVLLGSTLLMVGASNWLNARREQA